MLLTTHSGILTNFRRNKGPAMRGQKSLKFERNSG
jgi:hypothetical protein